MEDNITPRPNDQEASQASSESNKAVDESLRPSTDIILAQISLIKISTSSVREGYHFVFLKSRPILFIGRDTQKCGEHAIILHEESIQDCHASIRWKDGKLYLQDEGAGITALQGEVLVPRTMLLLQPKCVIRIGGMLFNYQQDFHLGQISPSEETNKSDTLPSQPLEDDATIPQIKSDSFSAKSYAKEPTGFVIAEFGLVSLDAPYAIPHHCEILSHRPYFLVGRGSQCDYQIEFREKYVAEEQATIQYSPQSQIYTIKNLVKDNPIFVNNKRVPEMDKIEFGDIIKLGVASQAPRIRFDMFQDHDDTNPVPDKHVAKELLLSEAVPEPQRGEIYSIGSNPENVFYIQDTNVPDVLAEIVVPYEGDYYLVRKTCDNIIPVFLDDIPLAPSTEANGRYGVNQKLRIGNYLIVQNNQRTLPPEILPFSWKRMLLNIVWVIFLLAIGIGIYITIQKYWPQIQALTLKENSSKEYQKNVFYIVTFSKDNKVAHSGTGFLITQKDAQEKDIFYIVTCKHVVQPWKFEEHQIKDKQVFSKDNQLLGTLLDSGQLDTYFIAIWPYDSQVMDLEKKSYLFQNSFNNFSNGTKLGNVEIHRLGEDTMQHIPDTSLQKHTVKSNQDIAVLKIIPSNTWKYSYHPWHIGDKKSLDIGTDVVVLGYPLGDERLLKKEGRALPVSAEGKVASDCQNSEFIEMNINQTQGASGGPIVNPKGQVMGIVSFSDGEKRLLYGIHGHILLNLLR